MTVRGHSGIGLGDRHGQQATCTGGMRKRKFGAIFSLV